MTEEKHSIKYWVQFVTENQDESDINYGLNKLIETAIDIEKENAKLNERIEIMKNCGNCKHWSEDNECTSTQWWNKCCTSQNNGWELAE